MRCRLALEKKIITSSLKDAIEEYKTHFSADDTIKELGRLEKYTALSEEELCRFSREEFFYENFKFMREEISKLNDYIKVQGALTAAKTQPRIELKNCAENRHISAAKVKCIKALDIPFY